MTFNKSWLADAPSNIALIKYMGKRNTGVNVPMNASLSYTLSHLKTAVKLTLIDEPEDRWAPLDGAALSLSSHAISRFLSHLQRIKSHFGYQGQFLVESSNNFPHGAGIASSASSFAALTRCAVEAVCDLLDKPLPELRNQAQLSSQGSGSSCRSFYSPWCLWNEEGTKPLSLPYERLLHQVVLLDAKEKTVSSSQAHQRVQTSPLIEGRCQRAEARLAQLCQALAEKDWARTYQLCWDEFIDMHQLFETASPAFAYRTPACHAALEQIKQYWEAKGDGPVVTMDAGANIHLLYRPDQQDVAKYFKEEGLKAHVLL